MENLKKETRGRKRLPESEKKTYISVGVRISDLKKHFGDADVFKLWVKKMIEKLK